MKRIVILVGVFIAANCWEEHLCQHDSLEIISKPVKQQEKYRALPSYQSIRLNFNFDSLNDDERACSTAGDPVNIGTPGNNVTCNQTTGIVADCVYYCNEVDILTSQKKSYLTNVRQSTFIHLHLGHHFQRNRMAPICTRSRPHPRFHFPPSFLI
jgi:hypothetical protein